MKSMQKGFTLIELMIVVAIIAILAAIAIPQYQTYVIKSQFTRVMSETGDQKVTVEDCINNNQVTAASCTLTATSSDLIAGGKLPVVAFTGAAPNLGATLTSTFGTHANANLSGTVVWTRNGSGAWTCSTTITNAAKYAPQSCQ